MPSVKSYRRTPSKRQKAQRTSLQLLGVRRLTWVVVGMSLCVLSLWGYFHASSLMEEGERAFEIAMARVGFTLEDVVVEGRIRTDKEQILQKLELERGKPLFSIDLSKAKAKLEEISWVKAVCVERRLPDTLFIRISEKEPVAMWQNQAKIYLVDRDGEIVETNEPHKYKDLLIVTGHQAPRQVGKLISLLEAVPLIKARVTGATHLRATRWDIELDGKVIVKLPERGADRALAYLVALENTHRLTDQEIITIDMRLPEQLILRLQPEIGQRKNDTGKDA